MCTHRIEWLMILYRTKICDRYPQKCWILPAMIWASRILLRTVPYLGFCPVWQRTDLWRPCPGHSPAGDPPHCLLHWSEIWRNRSDSSILNTNKNRTMVNLFYPYRISKQSLYTLCPKKNRREIKIKKLTIDILKREYYISTILIVFLFHKMFSRSSFPHIGSSSCPRGKNILTCIYFI